MTYSISIIRWKDHHSINEWVNKNEARPESVVCTTCGFLVYEDDEFYGIALTVNNIDQFDSVMYILKNCVVDKSDYKL